MLFVCYLSLHTFTIPDGPGASATLWKELFPQAELWEAELNAKCVRKAQQSGQALDGFHVLVGDQGDPKVLDSWVEKSNGGHFDVVVRINDVWNGETQSHLPCCAIWISHVKAAHWKIHQIDDGGHHNKQIKDT